MMRNNDEFKAEIFRRKEIYLKRRRTRVFALSSGIVSVVLCFSVILSVSGILGSHRNGAFPENEASDVMVSIHLPGRTLTASEDVDFRLEVLAKYVPLPEGKDTVEEFSDTSSNFENGEDLQVSPPTTSTSSQPESTMPVSVFTVICGNDSKTYCLREKSITADGITYSLTETEFNELFTLFGGENAK